MYDVDHTISHDNPLHRARKLPIYVALNFEPLPMVKSASNQQKKQENGVAIERVELIIHVEDRVIKINPGNTVEGWVWPRARSYGN